MDEALKFKLSLLGLPSDSLSYFSSGLKLYDLLLTHLPPSSSLLALKDKLKTTNLHQSGTCIININILLRYIKAEIECPQSIKDITAFKLENPETMAELVGWIAGLKEVEESHASSQSQSLNESEIQRQEDRSELNYQPKNEDLSNLYFVSEAKEEPHQEYSLHIPQEQVIRSNTSIKVLKPKTNFNDDSFLSHKQEPISQPPERQPKFSLPPRPNIPPLPRTSHRHNDDSVSNLSKDFDKSPTESLKPREHLIKTNCKHLQNSDVRVSTTARSHQQHTRDTHIELPAFETKKSQRLIGLEKEVKQIERSISKEKKDIASMKRAVRSTSTTQKPIEVPTVSESSKEEIVEWLISINLLNSLARKKKEALPQICKNGVIFPELINQKKQRTDPEVKYEAKPTKSAEIHANYRRVFDHLAKLNNFASRFLYAYENFVPEVNESVFWAFIHEVMTYYKSSGKKKPQSVTKIPEEDMTPLPPPVKTAREDYDKIKYSLGHKNVSKSRLLESKQLLSDSDDDCKERPLRARITSNLDNMLQSRIETNNSLLSVGSYQQLRMKKLISVDTPKRQDSAKKILTSTIPGSLQKSRATPTPTLRNSHLVPNKQQSPQTTKQMQMIAASYLKSQCLGIDLDNLMAFKEMFDDPIRNGTLLMLVVCKFFALGAQEFILKPSTINDCRLNLNKALQIIKNKQSSFPQAYLSSVEDIIRGDKTILFGIVYHLTANMTKTETSMSHSFVGSEEYQEAVLNWIKSLKPHMDSLKYTDFDSFEAVIEHMSTGILLNQLASLATKRTLKPVYDRPLYQVQYRANIIKSLEAMVEKEIVDKAYLWKAKKIASGDCRSILGLLEIVRKKLSYVGWQKGNAVSFQQLIKTYCTK